MAAVRSSLAESQPLQHQGSAAFSEALKASQWGWSVIPCFIDSKAPDTELLRKATGKSGWRQFQSRAPSIRELLDWQGAEAFGCVTGEFSRVVVLDVDPGGKESLKGKHLPPTMSAKTIRGEHYFYRWPPGGLPTKTALLKGVDVKGDGGYAVMPGPPGRYWFEGMGDPEGLADAPEWLVTACRRGTGRKHTQTTISAPKPVERPTEAPRAIEAPTALGGMAKNLTRWYSSPEAVLHLAPLLGIQTKGIGAACRDVMPGMSPDTKPSASLYQTERGIIVYRSFRMADQFWTLGELRASQAYGQPTRLATGKGMKPEGVCWAIRLLVEGRLIKPAAVPHRPLTDDAPESARKVYQGFIELLACKWLYTKGEPSPFSWRFAEAWCGMGQRQAGQGMRWLLSNGYMAKVGQYRRTALFLPVVKAGGCK